MPLLGPAAELPFHEPGPAAEVREAGRRGVDRVQVRERVDQRAADRLPLGGRPAVARRQLVTADVAHDPLHQVERNAEHAARIR